MGLLLNFGVEAEVRRVENAAAFSQDNERPCETTNEEGDNNEVGR